MKRSRHEEAELEYPVPVMRPGPGQESQTPHLANSPPDRYSKLLLSPPSPSGTGSKDNPLCIGQNEKDNIPTGVTLGSVLLKSSVDQDSEADPDVIAHAQYVMNCQFEEQCQQLTHFRFLQYVNNPAYERDTLVDAMRFFGIEKVTDPICEWISPDVVLKPHQLVAIHWMILKAGGKIRGGILGDDCGLGKVGQFGSFVVTRIDLIRTDDDHSGLPYLVDVQNACCEVRHRAEVALRL